MRRVRFAAIAALSVGALVSLSTPADAAGPVDVDCEVLVDAMLAVDAVFPPSSFSSYGDYQQNLRKDPELFTRVSGAYWYYSLETISFTSPQEMTATIGKCGLTKLQVELINN